MTLDERIDNLQKNVKYLENLIVESKPICGPDPIKDMWKYMASHFKEEYELLGELKASRIALKVVCKYRQLAFGKAICTCNSEKMKECKMQCVKGEQENDK